MKRENVLVSEDALARQREFEAKIKKMFTSREAHPVACVDTFGCQQNVADGQKLMGMLADSGFTFTRSSGSSAIWAFSPTRKRKTRSR